MIDEAPPTNAGPNCGCSRLGLSFHKGGGGGGGGGGYDSRGFISQEGRLCSVELLFYRGGGGGATTKGVSFHRVEVITVQLSFHGGGGGGGGRL